MFLTAICDFRPEAVSGTQWTVDFKMSLTLWPSLQPARGLNYECEASTEVCNSTNHHGLKELRNLAVHIVPICNGRLPVLVPHKRLQI